MASVLLDERPGFRRRIVVRPAPDWVRAQLEDDYHCLQVTIRHANGVAVAIEPLWARWPWSTCPGAVGELVKTFTGVALADFARRGEKSSNCTHHYDLAVLAAAHAHDNRPLIYDILVADPVDDGRHEAELRQNGSTVMHWALEGARIVEPEDIAGTDLFNMNLLIATLDDERKEAARLLRWGTMMAHGRAMTRGALSDSTRMPLGRCYTFQPHRIADARHVGEIRDFSKGSVRPLDDPALFEHTHSQDAA